MVLRVQNLRVLQSCLQTTALRERGSTWLPCPKPLTQSREGKAQWEKEEDACAPGDLSYRAPEKPVGVILPPNDSFKTHKET